MSGIRNNFRIRERIVASRLATITIYVIISLTCYVIQRREIDGSRMMVHGISNLIQLSVLVSR